MSVWTSILTFFRSNPVIGLVTTLATLLSVPLTLFLYFAGQQTRDLVFTVHPARTVIARAGRPSDLKVEFKGETITSDVVGAQAALWNEGKRSVHQSDVLSPIEIRLTPPAAILEASVMKKSRDIIGLTLDRNPEMLRQGRIPISFRILEQGDGGSIQVIYAGPSDVDISIIGIVEGAGSPRYLRQVPGETSPSTLKATMGKIGAIGAGLLFVWMGIRLLRKRIQYQGQRDRDHVVSTIVDWLAILVLFGAGFTFMFLLRASPAPPFGF